MKLHWQAVFAIRSMIYSPADSSLRTCLRPLPESRTSSWLGLACISRHRCLGSCSTPHLRCLLAALNSPGFLENSIDCRSIGILATNSLSSWTHHFCLLNYYPLIDRRESYYPALCRQSLLLRRLNASDSSAPFAQISWTAKRSTHLGLDPFLRILHPSLSSLHQCFLI